MSGVLDPWMVLVLIVLIVLFGLAGLAFFYFGEGRPRGGISTLTIRAVGIVFVVVAASLLAIIYESAVVAAVGLLGAVAGYLFGVSAAGSSESQASVGDISGDNAKVAGRDLVEKLESLNTVIDKYEAAVAEASGAQDCGYHVHEERLFRVADWSTSLEPTSEIALSHRRALLMFPPTEFRLLSVSTAVVSDFVHVVFVFAASSYPLDDVRLTLNAQTSDPETWPRDIGR